MTRPRYDADRRTITARAAELTADLTRHGITAIRAEILLHIDDGLAGTTWDGDGRTAGQTSPTERVALRRWGTADADLTRLDDMLDLLDQAQRIGERLLRDYQPTQRPPRPGIDPCPEGRCADHWTARESVAVARGRHHDLCRPCATFRQRYGRARTPDEIRAGHIDRTTRRTRPPHPGDGKGTLTTGGT